MGASCRVLLGQGPPPPPSPPDHGWGARRAQTQCLRSPCQAPGKAPSVMEGLKSRKPPPSPDAPPQVVGSHPKMWPWGSSRRRGCSSFPKAGRGAAQSVRWHLWPLCQALGVGGGGEERGRAGGFLPLQARPGVRCPHTRPWGRAASWTARAALARPFGGVHPCVSVLGGLCPCPGEDGAAFACPPPPPPLLSILKPWWPPCR